jgi:Arc/MetJ family transcription regulator
MRTTLDIDEKLLNQAMKVSGQPTKKATVEAGLSELLRKKLREDLASMAGKTRLALTHAGLEKMRRDE